MMIGIAGGTGSGKTTVAHRIIESVGPSSVVYLQQDSYCRNLGDRPVELRHHVNFDHPDAFDIDLLINHVEALQAGEAIEQPVYDYKTHSRKAEVTHVEPRPIIILEGILVFGYPDADIRFIRRLDRDVHERGRSLESVIEQYTVTVRPMHLQFVEPSKRYADVIIPEGGFNPVSIDLVTGKIKAILASGGIDSNGLRAGGDEISVN